MNENAQRIAIAEACGWRIASEYSVPGYTAWRDPKTQAVVRTVHLPDYLHDLNACYEMEKMLTFDQQRTFGWELNSILVAEMQADGCKTKFDYEAKPKWVWHATASNHCEAFLRTLNLWDETCEHLP